MTVLVLIQSNKHKTYWNFKWEIFNHSPYSPDLTPSAYYLFLQLKKSLGSEDGGRGLTNSNGHAFVHRGYKKNCYNVTKNALIVMRTIIFSLFFSIWPNIVLTFETSLVYTTYTTTNITWKLIIFFIYKCVRGGATG